MQQAAAKEATTESVQKAQAESQDRTARLPKGMKMDGAKKSHGDSVTAVEVGYWTGGRGEGGGGVWKTSASAVGSTKGGVDARKGKWGGVKREMELNMEQKNAGV